MQRLFGTLTVIIAAAALSAPPAAPRAIALTGGENALLAAINATRRAHGLVALRIDPRLELAARAHSNDMLRHDYFAHGDFGGRMLRFGVRGRLMAENLAWGTGTLAALTAVAWWMASPPHRANLLRRDLRRVGLAAPVGAFAGYPRATVVTADFAGS